jgi:hypothetical protein
MSDSAVSLFQVNQNISIGHNYENYDCYEYNLYVGLKDTASVLFSYCSNFYTSSASYEYKCR